MTDMVESLLLVFFFTFRLPLFVHVRNSEQLLERCVRFGTVHGSMR